MKRSLALILSLAIMLCFASCGKVDSTSSDFEGSTALGTTAPNTENELNHTHSYSKATCTEPAKCSCGEVSGEAAGHKFSAATCTQAKKCKVCGITEGSKLEHKYSAATCIKYATCVNCGKTTGSKADHKFSEATCTTPKTCVVCGYSYGSTEFHDWESATCVTPKTCKKCKATSGEVSSFHEWEYATCTEPKTCKLCGTTEGEAQGHSYNGRGNCYRCDQINPIVEETIAQCSLEVPTLPNLISYYNYSGNEKYSSVNVTNITYKFDCNNDGEISLDVYFSGEKSYDKKGTGQSDACRIGWKLYGPDGAVIKSGTFHSPSIAMGETFSNQEETVLYEHDNGAPGTYRLEILNVN